MRALVLACLAACGGASSSPAPTRPAGPASPESGEDWHGYLSQLAGTWTIGGVETVCRWLDGATFLACPGETAQLVGYEPHNRRYVVWRITPSGDVKVLSGIASSRGWTFESGDGRMTLTSQGPTQWALAMELVGGAGPVEGSIVVAGPTSPGAPSPAAAPGTPPPWRNALHPLVATWTFVGKDGAGDPVAFTETCRWISAATFIACKVDGQPGVAVVGYEPHTQRFVRWELGARDADVLVGTRSGKDWTFAGSRQRRTLTHQTGLVMAARVEEQRAGSWALLAEGEYSTELEESPP